MLKTCAALLLIVASPAFAADPAKVEARAEAKAERQEERAEAKAERQEERAEAKAERQGHSLPVGAAQVPLVLGLAIMGLRQWRRRS